MNSCAGRLRGPGENQRGKSRASAADGLGDVISWLDLLTLVASPFCSLVYLPLRLKHPPQNHKRTYGSDNEIVYVKNLTD